MKEINAIIQSYDRATGAGKRTALATVVHVTGSSYRKPGARMLITEEGYLTGAISGGCLEGDALRKAQLVIQHQTATLVTYNTMEDEDAIWGAGLGCNGIIQVLIEPIDPQNTQNPIELLRNTTLHRSNHVLATFFDLQHKKGKQPGTCWGMDAEGKVFSQDLSTPFLQRLQADATAVFKTQRASTLTYDTYTVLVEWIPPTIAIAIIGAGNDVQPLAEMAAILGWETSILDGRPNYARPDRFAPACQVIVAKPAQVLDHIPIDHRTAFVLMTHNYVYDKAVLHALCLKNAPYIGMLGSKNKLIRIFEEWVAEGFEPTERQKKNIHSPVGLDIGSETPEEIALSIVAQIQTLMAIS